MSFQHFMLSSFTLAVLLVFCFGLFVEVYKFYFSFSVDANMFKALSSQPNNGSRDVINSLFILYENKPAKATNTSLYEYERFLHGAGTEYRNTKTNVKSLSNSITTSSISSKKRLRVHMYVATIPADGVLNSVYGELGCPNNPWRKDLNDLL